MELKNDIICWWSGGVTSAVACKITIDLFGVDRCRFIMIDTKNEDDDTYRFKKDCEKWYGKEIEIISDIGEKYDSIQDVWIKHKSLNVAHGAICSSKLKKSVREKWQKKNEWNHQVFGFDLDEAKRAKSMSLNNPDVKAIYPLMMYGIRKKECINIIEKESIEIPNMYKLGFLNNNCFKTGCVQGGIGYWQKMKKEFPLKFEAMAKMEHKLTELQGKPITMLKDQSKNGGLVFLKPHSDYPSIKDISMMKGRKPEPLFECNGFCGTNDLEERKKSENDINLEGQLELF